MIPFKHFLFIEYTGLGLYKLSYLFVNPLGALAFLLVASIVSAFEGGKEYAKHVDPRLSGRKLARQSPAIGR